MTTWARADNVHSSIYSRADSLFLGWGEEGDWGRLGEKGGERGETWRERVEDGRERRETWRDRGEDGRERRREEMQEIREEVEKVLNKDRRREDRRVTRRDNKRSHMVVEMIPLLLLCSLSLSFAQGRTLGHPYLTTAFPIVP
ncbi:ATP-dependent rRNA helicase SPB4 [Dissostichus eleginoides]|uniref:ATP-dependent rRNA helicase SPB4 n=1 Tax=Dissostichus eleginoides TaxID=100907 RepID=A0AAD9BIE8_DISEL|nr:ATP-dependent rRNA helicase SPB4 [Dissostichus eleginoides]